MHHGPGFRPVAFGVRLLRGALGLVLSLAAIAWCSNAAALFFVVALEADDQRWLIAYPVMLFYTCFALFAVF